MKSRHKFIFCVFFSVAAIAVSHPPRVNRDGGISVAWQDYPSSLLYYLGFDDYSLSVSTLVLEPLLERDPETATLVPRLASRWSLSADKTKIGLEINGAAKFSDGTAVTAKDVCFTLSAIKNPTHRMTSFQEQFSSLLSCRGESTTKVEISVEPRFENLNTLAELLILPEHFFRGKDFNSAFRDHFIGSGPYVIAKAVRGQTVSLTRNPSYWGTSLPSNRGRFQMSTVQFRVIQDPTLQLEMLKKGEIDYLYFLSSKIWATETNGPLFDSGKIKKLKVENSLPHSLVAIAWNMRRPLFSDVRVRRALSHLFDRERMIRDLFYSNYIQASGLFHSRSAFHDKTLEPIAYDVKKARTLLQEAGWDKWNARGLRTKDGREFSFEILSSNAGSSRYLTLYQESLKRVGIEMKIKIVDWATAQDFTKKHNFDAWELVQARDLSPTYLSDCWGSKGAKIDGCNVSGYSDKETDALIAKFSASFSEKERHEILRKIERRFAEQSPVTLMWEQTHLRIAYWDKFSFDGKGYRAYSTWWNLFHDWAIKGTGNL